MSEEARRPKTRRYTEAETLAILEAERLGKPLPHAAATVTATPGPHIGTPEWLRKVQKESEELEAQLEAAAVYQLAFWPDDKRAMPTDFLACALFAAIQEKDASYFDGVQIANANGFQITFRGKRLTQVHADVWQGIMHLARQMPEGKIVRFSTRQLLRLIGRHIGKSQRDQLKDWIGEFVATNVEITDTKNKRRYFGSLLPRGAADDEAGNNSLYAVEINRDLAKLFNNGFATINWAQRRRLQKKPLALWLQHYLSKFTKPVAVAELHRLAGSTAELKEFRRKLRNALAELVTEKVLGSWRIDEHMDTVFFTMERSRDLQGTSEPRLIVSAAERPTLPLDIVPAVNEETRAKFRALYPDKDVNACLADFAAWLKKPGKNAPDRPMRFLGFAKKWG